MLFSIVVPMYNSEKYIRECIESVLYQTENDYELIIVNDGSIDECGKIADYYASSDLRIKVLHQENAGSFQARITGMDHCSGKYVVFLDADDTLKKNTLEKLKKYIKRHNPDILMYRAEIFRDDKSLAQSLKLFDHEAIFDESKKNILYEKLLKDSSLNNLWMKAIKLDCFDNEKVRHYPSVSMGDDILYLLDPITNASKILYIDEILYNYRIIQSSMTRSFQKDVYQSFKIVTNTKKKFLLKWGMETDINNQILFKRLLKNISGIALYSQADIDGKEREYLQVLSEIQKDSLFFEAYHSSFKNLSLLRKFPILLVKTGNFKLLYFLKKNIKYIHKLR